MWQRWIDATHYGRHIADNNCLAGGKDSETQIKPFYDFERRRELDAGAVVEECCYAMKGSSPQSGAKAMTRSYFL
jgi:hypothetical protein